jgi:hypothetical protein
MIYRTGLSDKLALYGDFGMRVFDHRSGFPVQVLHWRKRNQITNQGRLAQLTLMCPAADLVGQTLNRIWSLSVGTNAIPPSIDDDDTTMTIAWTSALDYGAGECTIVATPPNSYYLAISKTLGLGDANGSTLSEAGIFTRGNNNDPAVAVGRKLYARQVHSPVLKTLTMTVLYEWQLGVTIQS